MNISDRCLNCNERIEYFTDLADGVNRWLHITPSMPTTIYQECRQPRTVAEPGGGCPCGWRPREGVVGGETLSEHQAFCHSKPS